MGTYIHGLFDNPAITRLWLQHIGLGSLEISDIGRLDAREREYDRLAEHFENHIDLAEILELIRPEKQSCCR